MDFSLTDEQREMVATVRKLRQKVLAPNAIRWLNGDPTPFLPGPAVSTLTLKPH